MKRPSLLDLLLFLPCITFALILDTSCSKGHFVKGEKNLVEAAFRHIFRDAESLKNKLGKPIQQIESSFKTQLEDLFGPNWDAIRQEGKEGLTNLLAGDHIKITHFNGDHKTHNSVPKEETIVFCDLERFARNGDRYSSDLNGKRFSISEEFYNKCQEQSTPLMDIKRMSQAVTWGRYGEKLRLFPNEPNVIQICPQWIKYMVTLLEGDIDWYELRSYRAALERQNKILPWYLWPQREVSDSTKRFRHVGGNPKVVHISIDKAIWFEHTLFHELTHTDWWKVGTTLGLDDVPEEVKEVPGRPGTPNGTPPVAKIDAIPTGAYGWDDVVKYKRKDNADTWAYVLDCWFARSEVDLDIDTLGEFYDLSLDSSSDSESAQSRSGSNSGSPSPEAGSKLSSPVPGSPGSGPSSPGTKPKEHSPESGS